MGGGREFQGDEGSKLLGGRISPQGTVLLLRIGKQHITILKREGERKIERGVGEKFPWWGRVAKAREREYDSKKYDVLGKKKNGKIKKETGWIGNTEEV